MPQINRIRVNNVKYNFGTQVYDDFVMRFNCQNTIYDLANGGGKSLLMLLLMQNMLPNCTLDDKQPIEKLFRQGSGNTCIHSLVEWKLDPCYQKDGFRFMTTGFCARKGRGTDDENQDGQEQTAAPTASVEYFNYCIFYREFGDNDIKNLPLVSNGERITYNGLKAYLRDLEKGGYKYVVKIFDRKGDYQSFISNYGIYESAWEIVRGINKTEGHVRTYFESNYKTSRKVVEDLLIEEIIQKSFNNKLSVDNDEGMMAQTLMDIKDKLVELSKKHSQLGAYDSQIAAIDSFKEYLSTYEAFYNRKEEIEKQLYDLLLVAMRESDNAKDALNNLVKSSDSVREELESQEALLNRLEGSIAHGINQIENNYGSFNEFPCDDPDEFITQHKVLIKKLEDNTKVQERTRRQMSDSLKDILVCRKDLERIVSDAGMHVPEEFRSEDAQGISANLTEYEAVHKEYASITRLEYKKVDEFNKNKSKLIDLLNGFNAVELADEVRISLNVPENVAKTRSMIESLNETNTFIQLEKDRIAKGIEDMQMIKDNFENRCIQTCSNIKTELDRLPQLSNINLDGEQIAIISLQIPYIKEELYKEKMSEYIDETVFMAESFKEPAERLKYIRNRLSWKRLFSVIVTDMNSIRINLYKRERIKDQSRYLRYEEAVGSTGQSQGIYIQFLIAIINYISNMNSSGNEGVEGKTIFIDNPFGAAKDIYIWEPIFKLLATNHVQLIVPARGATPAITGRFDVNYILGQKLVDSRQQTVVVDYYSSMKESELEYTRMDYEQATFDFL